MKHAAALAAATPDRRDRYVDLLRVASLGIVIVGHWFMAVVLIGQDGAITVTNALALLPWLQPLTWVLQVMPIFFLVGGFSHATALASVQRKSGGYVDFVRARADRLLRPTAVFVAVWLVLAIVVELTGNDRGVLRLATQTVAQPLWFVGVYLGIIALAPPMLRLHRGLGRWAPVVPAGLAAGAVAVDVTRFAWGMSYIAYLNVLLVWLAVHQLGFLYADGSLFRAGRAFAGAGLAATAALTTFGPYPTSMVGMPGDRVSNMSPPTAALLAQAAGITGLALLLRGPLSRWLRRPRVWTNVVAANGMAMTAFLWHLTAMFAATAMTAGVGLARLAVGSPMWWLVRPIWITVLALFTTALVLAFRRADRPRPLVVSGRVSTGGTAVAAAGVSLCVLGILGLSAAGFGGLIAGRTATLVVLPVTPLLSAAILVVGAALLRAADGAVSRSPGR